MVDSVEVKQYNHVAAIDTHARVPSRYGQARIVPFGVVMRVEQADYGVFVGGRKKDEFRCCHAVFWQQNVHYRTFRWIAVPADMPIVAAEMHVCGLNEACRRIVYTIFEQGLVQVALPWQMTPPTEYLTCKSVCRRRVYAVTVPVSDAARGCNPSY